MFWKTSSKLKNNFKEYQQGSLEDYIPVFKIKNNIISETTSSLISNVPLQFPSKTMHFKKEKWVGGKFSKLRLTELSFGNALG